jgi:dihydroorotase
VKSEKYLIKNVRLFDPTLKVDQIGDLSIRDGKIETIGKNLSADRAVTLEGEGKLLTPGFVDLHSHLREPGFEHKETIETGSRAAAAGGFTTICCMANTEPVNDNASITHYILEQARNFSSVKILPIGAISKGLEGKDLAEIGELKKAGCVAISDDGRTVMNSELMRLAMDYAKGFDIPVITHCIEANLARGGSMHEGRVSCQLGLTGISAEAEDIIVARDIYLSQLTGCHLHVAHVSTEGSVELIRQAKKKGLPVTAEATPHHFTLTDEACIRYDTNAKMCPPLRTERDRQAVIGGLADGSLEAIATDHAPHATVDKEVEFDQAAFGILGFETAFPLALRLVEQKQLTLAQVIQLFTSKPLSILKRHYGGLKVGELADLVLIDPKAKWKYQVAQSYSKSRNSPFDGWEFIGKVVRTWVEGRLVHQA